MKRSGDSRKASPRAGLLQTIGALVARNPLAVGGITAFLVTFSFISANALWYQPHAHPGALFSTRSHDFMPRPKPQPSLLPDQDAVRPTVPAAVPDREAGLSPLSDPGVLQVQETLADLRLYDGPADGLIGPQTREAIQHYQRVVGLEQTGEIDAALLRHLGIRQEDPMATPVPAPRPPVQTASIPPSAAGDPVILGVQAGLRAFGNDHIELDGIAGKQTEMAVREFQQLFGLELNGRADEKLLAKMRDLGLVD